MNALAATDWPALPPCVRPASATTCALVPWKANALTPPRSEDSLAASPLADGGLGFTIQDLGRKHVVLLRIRYFDLEDQLPGKCFKFHRLRRLGTQCSSSRPY